MRVIVFLGTTQYGKPSGETHRRGNIEKKKKKRYSPRGHDFPLGGSVFCQKIDPPAGEKQT